MAVRNEDNSFYLCQTKENISKRSKKIRIRWLTQTDDNENLYFKDYLDWIVFECILSNVKLNKVEDKFELNENERSRILKVLKQSIKRAPNTNQNGDSKVKTSY